MRKNGFFIAFFVDRKLKFGNVGGGAHGNGAPDFIQLLGFKNRIPVMGIDKADFYGSEFSFASKKSAGKHPVGVFVAQSQPARVFAVGGNLHCRRNCQKFGLIFNGKFTAFLHRNPACLRGKTDIENQITLAAGLVADHAFYSQILFAVNHFICKLRRVEEPAILLYAFWRSYFQKICRNVAVAGQTADFLITVRQIVAFPHQIYPPEFGIVIGDFQRRVGQLHFAAPEIFAFVYCTFIFAIPAGVAHGSALFFSLLTAAVETVHRKVKESIFAFRRRKHDFHTIHQKGPLLRIVLFGEPVIGYVALESQHHSFIGVKDLGFGLAGSNSFIFAAKEQKICGNCCIFPASVSKFAIDSGGTINFQRLNFSGKGGKSHYCHNGG